MPVTHQKDGKASFTHVYDEPDPRPYFRTLGPLEYRTPGHAQPIFRRLLDAQREAGRGGAVLDLCCSYGLNAALLNHDVTLDVLYARYTRSELEELGGDELAAADRRFYAERRRDDTVPVGGCDVAGNAVRYAERAGLVDVGFVEDLESDPPSGRLSDFVAEVDLVTITGGVGYVGDRTLERILDARRGRPPWIAAFALRVVDYDPIAGSLTEHGLVTETLDRPFRQRRFAGPDERDYVLRELEESGVGIAGEDEGYYLAELHVSRPVDEAGSALDELVA